MTPGDSNREPLVIAAQGYFFVGGHYGEATPGRPLAGTFTGQMYVEYQIPHEVRSPCPIVMIHGGFQTGTNFTGTPDGREGWAQFFLRRGWPVYVVDTVGRGRSMGNLDTYGEQRGPDLDFAQARFVAPKRSMLWPQADKHTQFPGEAQPVTFSVHGAIAEHYKVAPDAFPPHATTLDYIVAAAAG